MNKAYIYTLTDPRNNNVRYIGKTNNPKARQKAHMVITREVDSHKKNWVRQLKSEGLKPVFEVLDEVPIDEWVKWERYWIQQFKCWGFELVNHTAGGDGLTYGNQTSFRPGNGSRPIVELNLDGSVFAEYKSIKEARISFSGINKKGKITRRNTVVLYKETFEEMSREDVLTYIKDGLEIRKTNEFIRISKCISKGGFKKNSPSWNKGKGGYRARPRVIVYQYNAYTGDFIKEWHGLVDIELELYISADSVGNCLNKKSKSAGGYIWRYEKLDSVDPVVYNSKTWNTIKNKKHDKPN